MCVVRFRQKRDLFFSHSRCFSVAEAYLQSLAKALANQFSARLLLLDVIDFACKVS
jgi:hypothetical protein